MSVVKQAGAWLRRDPFRIYFVATVLAVLPLSLFVLTAHKLFLRQVIAQSVAQSSHQGRSAGLVIEQHLNAQKVFLEAVALRPDLLRAWQRKDYDSVIAALSDLHKLRSDLLGFGIFDVDGTLRAVAPADNSGSIGQNYSSRPWYGPVTSTGRPYVSPAFRSVRPGNPLIVAIAVPLIADGKPVGILVSGQTLEEVTEPVYSLLPAAGYKNLAFVDQDGQVFGVQSPGARAVVLDVERQTVIALKQEQTGAGRVLQIGGQQYIAAYSPIPSLNWGVLIQAPTALIGSSLWVYEKNVAFLAAMVVVLALGGGGLLAYLYKRLRDNEQLYIRQIEAQNHELEMRNRAIENASQLKTKFLATMSHELRTPLNAVLGFATLLSEESALGVKQRRWAEHIRDGGRHLLQLVNDVLDLSKIEAGRLELHREVFAVDTAVPEVIATLSPLIQAKKIRMNASVESGLLVYADRMRFKQVLYNLMSNALKFTPASGEVTVRARQRGDSALIEVQDNGIGIRSEDQERIFDEFSQAAGGDGNSLGTGLGLAITKRLVAQHGGQLWVKSEFGSGSCFSFVMPLGYRPEEQSAKAEARSAQP